MAVDPAPNADASASPRFAATVEAARLTLSGPDGRVRTYPLGDLQHGDYLDLFERIAADFGTRAPLSRAADAADAAAGPHPRLRPLLTRPVAPQILYGYGDPSVIRSMEDGRPVWRLVVTSNDAPDAFPILRSHDMQHWTLTGFAFPAGEAPGWTLTGPDAGDFWAPELHRVGEEYWLCFAARRHDGELAIGLAKAGHPEGPFAAQAEPLLGGGVIDPHILVDRQGRPLLVWKVDANHLWPGYLVDLLAARPGLIGALFPSESDRRTAALVVALGDWTATRPPMEQFFLRQPLIEAATADFPGLRARLQALGGPRAEAILEAMRTRIFAQPLAPDGSALVGEPIVLLENDRDWEAHLIEGVWITRHGGRHYLFYAANDFSTPHYGIGVAVADELLGPYRKRDGPLLRSNADWWGPGHPSVAPGPDGRPRLFLHAFFPGHAGYKAFRALLVAGLEFEGDQVRVIPG
jgi:hypothetical protein